MLVSAAVIAAQSANAADLPARPAYKAPVQIISWDWTGPYLGVYAGIAASRSRSIDPTGAIAGVIEHTGYGFTGGGTIGYNWQTSWNIMGGAVVVGLEGDIGYFDAGRSATDWNTAASPTSTTRRGSGTARGRVGLAVGPNLTYFTGGYAALDIDDTVHQHRHRRDRLQQQGPERLCARQRPRDHARRRLDGEVRIHVHDFGDGDTLVNGGVRCRPRSSAITASASA